MGIEAHMTVILTPTLWDLPSVNLNNRLIPWKESFTQNQTNMVPFRTFHRKNLTRS